MEDIATLSGKSVGLSENDIVIWNKKTGEKKTVTLTGRRYYVARCTKEEIVGGIAIPDPLRDETNFCVVLAWGTGCGKRHKLTDVQIKMGIAPSVVSDAKINDRIMVPQDSPFTETDGPAIMRSPYGKNEFLVHECAILGVLEDE